MTALSLEVIDTIAIGNAIQRLVLQGEGLNNTRIPEYHAGLHIKLFFKKKQQQALTLPTVENGKVKWPSADLKPIARTYSIAGFCAQKQQLTVDFVLHEEPGIACDFARNAKPGDRLGFAGPGPAKLVKNSAEHYLFVGDLSATPAISAAMEALPSNVQISTFIELEELCQQDDLRKQYFKSTWASVTFVPQLFKPNKTLLPLIKELNLDRTWSVTLAGEHSTVTELRTYFKSQGFEKSALYAVPYWRYTMDEETYHQERHAVMDEI